MVEERHDTAGYRQTYEYDASGNLLCKKKYSTYDGTLVDTVNYTYATTGWKDQLVSYNGETITYNLLGNPITYRGHQLSWERATLLSSFDDNTFEYNANGIRIKKNNTTYELDGTTILSETTNGKTIRYYYANSGIVGFIYNNVEYYYQKNIQGDITAIYREDGTLMGEYSYDAWGNCTVTTDVGDIATLNPFRYRGYYFDVETGLYYLNTRYYAPDMGRFISPDSTDYLEPETVNGLNLYAYCGNNPVNYFDPSGHALVSILIAMAIGAVLGGIYGGISAAANEQNIWAGIAIGAIVGGLTNVIIEVASVPLMLLGTFTVGVAGDIASQMVLDGKSFGEVNILSASFVGVANAGLTLFGKGLSVLDGMSNLNVAEKIIFGTITNSPLLALGMAINLGLSKHSSIYTVNDLCEDVWSRVNALTERR